jgi:hypothetical protein
VILGDHLWGAILIAAGFVLGAVIYINLNKHGLDTIAK